MNSEPLVTVGIPTYNRPGGLEKTLHDIRHQTYERLEIIVSDNDSPDAKVEQILKSQVAEDPRIRFFRQSQNFGIGSNFDFVWRQSSGDYFMWAADDDRWESGFIASLIGRMDVEKNIGMGFCNFDVRYPDGSDASTLYPPFSESFRHFTEANAYRRLRSFILQPENHGKANLFYSLFRRDILVRVNPISYLMGGRWGFDMLLACDALSRTAFALDESIQYHVGIAANNASPSSADTSSLPPALKTREVGYFSGYIQIILRSPLLNSSQKLKLLLTCGRKAMRWTLLNSKN